MKVYLKDMFNAFQNANTHFLSTRDIKKDIKQHVNHKQLFEKIYNVKVERGQMGEWESLEFPDEESYTWFMMKWG